MKRTGDSGALLSVMESVDVLQDGEFLMKNASLMAVDLQQVPLIHYRYVHTRIHEENVSQIAVDMHS
jgi:hypothetical protein